MLLKSVLASFLASAMLDNERHLFSPLADALNEN
jgi:hypothetical protein